MLLANGTTMIDSSVAKTCQKVNMTAIFNGGFDYTSRGTLTFVWSQTSAKVCQFHQQNKRLSIFLKEPFIIKKMLIFFLHFEVGTYENVAPYILDSVYHVQGVSKKKVIKELNIKL